MNVKIALVIQEEEELRVQK